jgi:hypothetical protein
LGGYFGSGDIAVSGAAFVIFRVFRKDDLQLAPI